MALSRLFSFLLDHVSEPHIHVESYKISLYTWPHPVIGFFYFDRTVFFFLHCIKNNFYACTMKEVPLYTCTAGVIQNSAL